MTIIQILFDTNIDAVETTKHFGIQENRAVTFHSNHSGTRLNGGISNRYLC